MGGVVSTLLHHKSSPCVAINEVGPNVSRSLLSVHEALLGGASKSLRYTERPVIAKMYQLMFDVHRVLTAHGVQYWITSGTLLGAVRHKGIIPWDDDLDVCILDDEVALFNSAEPAFEALGYRTVKHWLGYKIFDPSNQQVVSAQGDYSFPFVDVLVYHRKGVMSSQRYESTSQRYRRLWPRETFAAAELFPLRQYMFGDFEVYGPCMPLAFLCDAFGDDWNNVAHQDFDHLLECHTEPVRVELTDEMRTAARPTGVRIRPIRTAAGSVQLAS